MDSGGDDPHNVSDDGGLGDGRRRLAPYLAAQTGGWSFITMGLQLQRRARRERSLWRLDGAGREPFLELQAGYAPFYISRWVQGGVRERAGGEPRNLRHELGRHGGEEPDSGPR